MWDISTMSISASGFAESVERLVLIYVDEHYYWN